jgi:hypothetical protein
MHSPRTEEPHSPKATNPLAAANAHSAVSLGDYPSKWGLIGQDQATVSIQTTLAFVTDIIWVIGPFLENLTPI